MDPKIVRAILRNNVQFMEKLANENDLNVSLENLPVIDRSTSNALSTSLTNLLAYRVSPDAYQKYSVRLKLIEISREWIRPHQYLISSFPTFNQNKNVELLCRRVLKEFISSVNFDNIDLSREFCILGRELINISKRNNEYIPCVKSFIEKMISSNMAFDVYKLVNYILSCDEKLELEFSLIEKLYIQNCAKLIEEPLIDCFIMYSKNKESELFTVTNDFEKLMAHSAKSSKIFLIISGILKTLFLHLEFSASVLIFIQFALSKIASYRHDGTKYIVDLYPLNLQSCVILLKIDPCHHTSNSRKFILETFKKFYLKNTPQVLILLTHFPKWLSPLSYFISKLIEN